MARINLCDISAIESIRVGEAVYLTGSLYVGRDQVHKLIYDDLINSRELPYELKNSAIYYMGPSPAFSSYPIGSAGPTTSTRMDPFTPLLLDNGLKVIVGKGPRSITVLESLKKNKGVYLQAFGGCGALYSSKIKSSKIVAYPFLGPEALLLLEVEDFPTICVCDSTGSYLPSILLK